MSVLSAIGNTPLVELTNINPYRDTVRILCKLEGSNPGGSIKDRAALKMINRAEEKGLLSKDKTILEATSGNTGIAIAMIGAAKGYKVMLFLPLCVSEERQRVLEAFGAKVVLTPAIEKTDGAIRSARELLAKEPESYYMPDQFSNEDNLLAHYETTAPEILRQTGHDITDFVAGMGTTGTLMGVSAFFRDHRPSINVYGVEPLLGHSIQGLKNMTESIVPSIYDPSLLTDIISVDDDSAFSTARDLAVKEGIFSGISSGAAVYGALKLAEERFNKNQKATIVTVLPDRGDRYLSTTLFRSICAKCEP
jgi:cysteine synthase B